MHCLKAKIYSFFKDFIFNYEGIEGIRKKYKDIYNWNLTKLGELLKERYPEELLRLWLFRLLLMSGKCAVKS